MTRTHPTPGRQIFSLALIVFFTLPGAFSFAEDSPRPKCPQSRKTVSAPPKFLAKKNPLEISPEVMAGAKLLYEKKAQPLACKWCHGPKGDGVSDPDFQSTPPARNFTCKETMSSVLDGQLFWVIKNGSKDTSMPAHGDLTEEQVWGLVHYIRNFSK